MLNLNIPLDYVAVPLSVFLFGRSESERKRITEFIEFFEFEPEDTQSGIVQEECSDVFGGIDFYSEDYLPKAFISPYYKCDPYFLCDFDDGLF